MSEEAPQVVAVVYDHPFDEGVKGWIYRTAKKNYWRVASWYDFDDLIQDGYLDYCRCRQIYAHIEDQGHFMSLFKTTFLNRITDLANGRSRSNETLSCELTDDLGTNEQGVQSYIEQVAGNSELPSIAELLKRAPWEVCQVLQLFATDVGLMKLREPFKKNKFGVRESTNEHLCRLLNLEPSEHDLVKELKDFLST